MLTHRNGASSRKYKKEVTHRNGASPLFCLIELSYEVQGRVEFIFRSLGTYLFLAKNCCMSARHSSSSTPDVTIVLGCSAWGAYLV